MDKFAQLKASLDSGDQSNCKFSLLFEPIDVIGQGAFGRVIKAKDKILNEEVAVKVISKKKMGEELRERVKQEANFLQKMNHPNVVSFKSVQETETRVLIAMELISGGSLANLIKKRKQNNEWFSESEVSTIMKNIMLGIAYIHSKNIVHRDLKPENILIGDENNLETVKIADFGLSSAFKLGSTNGLTEQCGTLLYMAPEFFFSRTYSKQIDIWSCGVTMHLLLDKGNHPFYDPSIDDSETFKIKLAAPKWRYPPQISERALSLLKKLTLLNSTERYSANQALQHPFLTNSLHNDIPMTMNEQLLCLKKQDILIKKIKAIFILKYLQQNSMKQLPKSQEGMITLQDEYQVEEQFQQNENKNIQQEFQSEEKKNSSSFYEIFTKPSKNNAHKTKNDQKRQQKQKISIGSAQQLLRKPPLNFLIKKSKGKVAQIDQQDKIFVEDDHKQKQKVSQNQLSEGEDCTVTFKNQNSSPQLLEQSTKIQNCNKLIEQSVEEIQNLAFLKLQEQENDDNHNQSTIKAHVLGDLQKISSHLPTTRLSSAKRIKSEIHDQEYGNSKSKLESQISQRSPEKKSSNQSQGNARMSTKMQGIVNESNNLRHFSKPKGINNLDESSTCDFKEKKAVQKQFVSYDRSALKTTGQTEQIRYKNRNTPSLQRESKNVKDDYIQMLLPLQGFEKKESTQSRLRQFKEKLQHRQLSTDYQEYVEDQINMPQIKGYLLSTKATNNRTIQKKFKS